MFGYASTFLHCNIGCLNKFGKKTKDDGGDKSELWFALKNCQQNDRCR